MIFASKAYLLLLLLLIPYILWYYLYRRRQQPTMRMSDTRAYEFAPRSLRTRLVHLPMLLRCTAFALIVIALARPQTLTPWNDRQIEGIDIMLTMDVSYSMLAEDVSPNRLTAAKDVAQEFIARRPNDNIGLTIFAGEAYTQCPMTTDHTSLNTLMANVRPELVTSGIISDGTAIGMGLANALSRLKDSKTKSRIVILLTDGSNNAGDISPLTAAEIAKQYGIRVYTIGLGTNGMTRIPINVGGVTQYTQQKGDIDYRTLQEIARTTGANFYRADSRSTLSEIYKEIDKLEKTKLKAKSYARHYDCFQLFAAAALAALLLELLLRLTLLRRIP